MGSVRYKMFNYGKAAYDEFRSELSRLGLDDRAVSTLVESAVAICESDGADDYMPTMGRVAKCSACSGTGIGDDGHTCRECGGTGTMMAESDYDGDDESLSDVKKNDEDDVDDYGTKIVTADNIVMPESDDFVSQLREIDYRMYSDRRWRDIESSVKAYAARKNLGHAYEDGILSEVPNMFGRGDQSISMALNGASSGVAVRLPDAGITKSAATQLGMVIAYIAQEYHAMYSVLQKYIDRTVELSGDGEELTGRSVQVVTDLCRDSLISAMANGDGSNDSSSDWLSLQDDGAGRYKAPGLLLLPHGPMERIYQDAGIGEATSIASYLIGLTDANPFACDSTLAMSGDDDPLGLNAPGKTVEHTGTRSGIIGADGKIDRSALKVKILHRNNQPPASDAFLKALGMGSGQENSDAGSSGALANSKAVRKAAAQNRANKAREDLMKLL